MRLARVHLDESPRIYLALDNCFALKRWTSPAEWAPLIRDLGVTCIEANTDTEADPLYAGPQYLSDWKREVLLATADCCVQVVNLYSGHGTYSTLGLAHPDRRVRERIKEQWVKPMVETAAELGAGFGFYCHAFPHAVMQDPSLYSAARDQLVDCLADIAVFGARVGVRSLGVEQMYAPHQIPWTITGAVELLEAVYGRSRVPFHLTIDMGHAEGQRRFAMPTHDELRNAAAKFTGHRGAGGRGFRGRYPELWLGTDSAYRHFNDLLRQVDDKQQDRCLSKVEEDMRRHPYLFSAADDTNPYEWLRALSAWSPIVHLQQVTGDTSSHEPFTVETNRRGRIHPLRVLEAIAACYADTVRWAGLALPERCRSVYLTLEIFAGAGVAPHQLLDQIRESVAYWRRWIPEDGRSLATLLEATPLAARANSRR